MSIYTVRPNLKFVIITVSLCGNIMKSALLVESDLAEFRRIARYLGRLSYVINPVQCLEEALLLAHTLSFDIVIMNTAVKKVKGELSQAN